MYNYSIWQWILLFYVYCFAGWCFESAVVSVQQHRLINRGFLRGPMLPIYGFGAIMLLLVSLPLYQQPVLLFLASALVATAFEFVVGALMEKLFKVKYWDYSKHRFQFKGYICLQSTLCWGVMGLILSHVLHPPISQLVTALPAVVTVVLCIVIGCMFLSDVAVSVRTALDLAAVLVELDKLHQQAEELRGQLSATALEAKERMTQASQEARLKVSLATMEARDRAEQASAEARDRAADTRESIQKKLDEVQRAFEQRATGLSFTRKSLLRGNPTASSSKYDVTLQRLKSRVTRGRRG